MSFYVNKNMIYKIGYAYAYRLPSLAEQFADDVYTSGNTELDPETANSIHGTIMFSTDNNKFNFEFTVFHQEIESLIQYQYNPAIFRSVPQNHDKFRSTGIDCNMNYKLNNFMNIGIHGVYQVAKQTYDSTLEYRNAN